MKKVIFAVLAIASLASCNKERTLRCNWYELTTFPNDSVVNIYTGVEKTGTRKECKEFEDGILRTYKDAKCDFIK